MKVDLIVPVICYKSYIRYEYEILLEVNQSIIDSSHELIKKNILNLKLAHLYQDLKFHQDMIKNFLYFNQIELLKKYILWRYRVYASRQIDLEYIFYEYEIWQTISKKFVDSVCVISINKIYDWLLENHNLFIKESLEQVYTLVNSLESELYDYAISGAFESFLSLAKNHCNTLSSFCDFFSTHITNITQYIGYQWEINQLSVAKEHLSSNIIEKTAFALLESFPMEIKNNKLIIISAAKDEYHFLGGKIAIAILEKMGYRVINLGVNTPKSELISIYNEFRCDFIILVSSLPTSLESTAQTIQEIKTYDFEEKIKVIISGNAYKFLPKPLEILGADLYLKNYIEMYRFFSSMRFD